LSGSPSKQLTGKPLSRRYCAAFQRYEQQLRRFIADKQRAAVQLARSFAPKTQLGIFFRNQVTKAFKLPLVAKLAIGRSLFDRIDLPDYPVSVGVVPRTQ